jgi:hypothetical protein
MTVPAPVVEEVRVGSRTILVLRDDLVPGGTKRRVLPAILADMTEEEFVFGGPAQGYAQVALAYSAADVEKRATYFVAARKNRHPLTIEAESAGARIVEVPFGRLSVVQARARSYCAETGARFLPLGFDSPDFRRRLADFARTLPVEPREVWSVAGSGTLSGALQEAWPEATHHTVRIGFDPKTGTAVAHAAPEAFAAPASVLPPFPSCSTYDAKGWRFVIELARDGALFWNVAA